MYFHDPFLVITLRRHALDPIRVLAQWQHGRGAFVTAREQRVVRIQQSNEEVHRATVAYHGAAPRTRAVGPGQPADAQSLLAAPSGTRGARSGVRPSRGVGGEAGVAIDRGPFQVQEPLANARILVVSSIPADGDRWAALFRETTALVAVERQIGRLDSFVESEQLIDLQ